MPTSPSYGQKEWAKEADQTEFSDENCTSAPSVPITSRYRIANFLQDRAKEQAEIKPTIQAEILE